MYVCPKKHNCGSWHRTMELQPISVMVGRSSAHFCAAYRAAHRRGCGYFDTAGKNSAYPTLKTPRTQICGSSGRSLPQRFSSSKGPPRARKLKRSHLHNTDRTCTHGVGALSIMQPSGEDTHPPTFNAALKAHNRTHVRVEEAGRPTQTIGCTLMGGRRTAMRVGLQKEAAKRAMHSSRQHICNPCTGTRTVKGLGGLLLEWRNATAYDARTETPIKTRSRTFLEVPGIHGCSKGCLAQRTATMDSRACRHELTAKKAANTTEPYSIAP